jgi:hypothetical protein
MFYSKEYLSIMLKSTKNLADIYLWLDTDTNELIVPNTVKDYYEPQHIYILSLDPKDISEGCYMTDGEKIYHNKVQLDSYINLFKIVASTDKQITERSLITEPFISNYVIAYNRGNPMKKVNLEMTRMCIQENSNCGTNKSIYSGCESCKLIPKTDNNWCVHVIPEDNLYLFKNVN